MKPGRQRFTPGRFGLTSLGYDLLHRLFEKIPYALSPETLAHPMTVLTHAEHAPFSDVNVEYEVEASEAGKPQR